MCPRKELKIDQISSRNLPAPNPATEPLALKPCFTSISNTCTLFTTFLVCPKLQREKKSTLRMKIKEGWITMLAFFCFLPLLPNFFSAPSSPQAPSTRRPTPLCSPSRSLLADFLATLIALPSSFLLAPYLHINGTVPP